ncbi:hypothetical protein LX32DRAFT_129939 [Colletotrichum zoysiae]|uniref:Uncharacterized protein n=1 Tax=Colletotrichum zoysiae TaxID=1216348 RepID=A0AAD9HQA3_9PEZI|nr:hypothetical protein LX32DRAFT_129939 [Colletotrichum zoysiae]
MYSCMHQNVVPKRGAHLPVGPSRDSFKSTVSQPNFFSSCPDSYFESEAHARNTLCSWSVCRPIPKHVVPCFPLQPPHHPTLDSIEHSHTLTHTHPHTHKLTPTRHYITSYYARISARDLA